ncbi:MAG: hypothetical protein ACE5KA_01150 [Nitrososphaerales archaeon]
MPLDIEIILMLVIAYVVGLISVIVFNRYRPTTSHVAPDYESRFRAYEEMLVDMRIRVDTLELRATEGAASQVSHASQVSQESHDQAISDKPKTVRRSFEQEGTQLVDYVLKLLADGPRTSRQIESVIGRSREHTARLMKKLFDLGYVTRDTTAKPYAYALTDTGKKVLSQVASVT